MNRVILIGRLGADQVEDYAGRKGQSTREVERWLAPNLNYTPDDHADRNAAA